MWRNILAWFRPTPRPKQPGQTHRSQSPLGFDSLEDRTVPAHWTGTWGMDLVGPVVTPPSGLVRPGAVTTPTALCAEPAQSIKSTHAWAEFARETFWEGVGRPSQMPQAPSLLRFQTDRINDAVFTRITPKHLPSTEKVIVSAIKHDSAPNPFILGTLAMVAIPLVHRTTREGADRFPPRPVATTIIL